MTSRVTLHSTAPACDRSNSGTGSEMNSFHRTTQAGPGCKHERTKGQRQALATRVAPPTAPAGDTRRAKRALRWPTIYMQLTRRSCTARSRLLAEKGEVGAGDGGQDRGKRPGHVPSARVPDAAACRKVSSRQRLIRRQQHSLGQLHAENMNLQQPASCLA